MLAAATMRPSVAEYGRWECMTSKFRLTEQAPQAECPTQIAVRGRAERVHRDAGLLQLGHERILVLEDVGHLVVETLAVAMADHVDQQLFGTRRNPGT